jgi:DKNYY family
MRQVFYVLAFIIMTLQSCNAQSKYFQPTGIVEKTEELKKGKTEWYSLKNNESVDGYTKIGDSIFGGEIACNIRPLEGIHLETFQVLAGTLYAKDINHVYYPLRIPCVEYRDCGVCYYGEIIMANAKPLTFRYLGKDYATDGTNVYFRGRLIDAADGATFKVIDGPEFFYFATDSVNVFKHGTIFKGANPATFYYDKDDPRNVDKEYIRKYIIGDKNKEWEYIPPDSIREIQKK